MKKAKDFDDLLDTMTADSVDALKRVYEHVDDIDLFTGMMSERPIKGALVGSMVGSLSVRERFGSRPKGLRS